MGKQDDPHYVVRIEKAIEKKYGYEAIQNPKANWTPEKEKEYRKQVKEFYTRQQKLDEKSEKVEVDGIFVPKKLLSKKSNRTCPTCNSYSFKLQDDIYMNKYGCCFNCYIFLLILCHKSCRWSKWIYLNWLPQNLHL